MIADNPEELLTAVLALPDEERLAIATRLLASVSPDLANCNDGEWLEELNRRYDAYIRDPGQGVDWDVLKDELHG